VKKMLGKFFALIGMAWVNFENSKARWFLMLLSMAIGVFSLTTVLVVSEIGRKAIFDEIQSFGVNRIWAFRDLNDLLDDPNADPWTSNKMISNEVIEEITQYCKDVRLIAPGFWLGAKVAYFGKVFEGVLLVGAGTDWAMIHNEQLANGRFIAPIDEARRSRICVLSGKARKLIFGEIEALGMNLQIADEYFTVVGILKNNERPLLKSINAAPLREEAIIIPFSVLQSSNWHNTRNVEYLDFQITGFNKLTQVAEDLKNYLCLKYGNEFRFQVKMLYFEIQKAKRIMRILTIVLGIISGVALLIAGIGIMNMMLASIIERFFEIGIRRAIGATRKDILFQFMVEAIMVGAFGGIIGILAAISVLMFCRVWLNIGEISLLPAMMVALSVSVLTGLLAGIYPARKAAKLNPSEALMRV